MPASTKDTARDASIYTGATLSDLLMREQYPRRAARVASRPTREYLHSTTLSSDREYKSWVNATVGQIAAGIKADYPDGFECVEFSYPELQDRFPGQAISRAQVMGIFVVALTHGVGSDKMQLTLLVRTQEWQQSPK